MKCLITPHEYNLLQRLIQVAAEKQTQEHNRPDVSSEEATEAVETFAALLGFQVIWPGLYPVFVKNGREYYCKD
jgi:hypothetical protein